VSLQQVLLAIESHEFAARLGVANTMGMLLEIARQEQPVKELLVLLQDREQANKFLAHLISRLGEQEDVRYRNSRDITLAVSLSALQSTQPALAKLLAAQVLRSPRLWWARRAAIELAFGAPAEPSTHERKETVTTRGDWGTVGTLAKDVLIVAEPPADLISAEKIINPNEVEITSDALKAETEIAGEFTSTGNQTTSTTVVRQ
jgi:hypothetical protein